MEFLPYPLQADAGINRLSVQTEDVRLSAQDIEAERLEAEPQFFTSSTVSLSPLAR